MILNSLKLVLQFGEDEKIFDLPTIPSTVSFSYNINGGVYSGHYSDSKKILKITSKDFSVPNLDLELLLPATTALLTEVVSFQFYVNDRLLVNAQKATLLYDLGPTPEGDQIAQTLTLFKLD